MGSLGAGGVGVTGVRDADLRSDVLCFETEDGGDSGEGIGMARRGVVWDVRAGIDLRGNGVDGRGFSGAAAGSAEGIAVLVVLGGVGSTIATFHLKGAG